MRAGNHLAAALAKGLLATGLLASGLLASGCAPTLDKASEMPRLEVGVAFGLENLCAGSQSPAIAIANLPAGATRVAVRLSNIGVLRQTPRDWVVDAPAGAPARIPAGALSDYSGPCPGDLQRPIYRVEVLAMAADGTGLGHGFREMRLMPVNRVARERRETKDQTWSEDLEPPETFFGVRELFLRERDVDPFPTHRTSGRGSIFAPAQQRDPVQMR